MGGRGLTPIRLYPDHPPLHRFSLRKGEYGLRLPVPKKAWGRVDESRPPPFPKQAGPAGSPVARLTWLPVDFDVEVALRPVLRPHSDRGGSKKLGDGGGKAVRAGLGGARASVTSRRPVATAPEAETVPHQASRLPWRCAHTPCSRALHLVGLQPETSLTGRVESSTTGRRSPTPLNGPPPRPPAGSPIATLNPARAGTVTASTHSKAGNRSGYAYVGMPGSSSLAPYT